MWCMSYHQYYCSRCEQEFELKIYNDENKWILVEELSEKEIAALPESEDPRFFSKETTLKDIPETFKCPECGKKSKKVINEVEGWVKGNCAVNRERERKFHEYGMNKQQSENFYKESIEASKERMKTGGSVYKKVDANMEVLQKQGLARKLNDKESADKRERVKGLQQHLAKTVKKPKK